MGPAWLTDAFTVIMLAVAVYCAARLVIAPVRHRRIEPDIDIAHLGMGITMAAMFVPHHNPLVGRGWNTTWEVVFTIATAWFLLRRALRTLRSGRREGEGGGHYLPHAVHSGAMLYMFLAIPTTPSGADGSDMSGMAMSGMAGMSSSAAVHFPSLALLLTVFIAGYSVLVCDRITPLTSATKVTGLGEPGLMAPRAVAVYKIATSIAMAYMLITMV